MDYAIPLRECRRLVNVYPYASKYRLCFLILCLTGMRIHELQGIRMSSFCGNTLIWKTAKGKGPYRQEIMPEWFMAELREYVRTNPTREDSLFCIDPRGLRFVLAHFVRPALGGAWLEKRGPRGFLSHEYRYQLKGLRHTYASLAFHQARTEFKDSTFALELTGRRLGHSTAKTTVAHYIDDYRSLGLNGTPPMDMARAVHQPVQHRLIEYF